MEKVYKRSLIAFIYNLMIMGCGGFVLFLIVGVIGGYKIAIGVSGICVILIFFSIIRQMKTKVIIKDNCLSIYDGKKKFHYHIEEVHLWAEQRNNDSFLLYVLTADGHQESFDLSLLGVVQYHQLLEDLGIVGEKSKTIKLDVSK